MDIVIYPAVVFHGANERRYGEWLMKLYSVAFPSRGVKTDIYNGVSETRAVSPRGFDINVTRGGRLNLWTTPAFIKRN